MHKVKPSKKSKALLGMILAGVLPWWGVSLHAKTAFDPNAGQWFHQGTYISINGGMLVNTTIEYKGTDIKINPWESGLGGGGNVGLGITERKSNFQIRLEASYSVQNTGVQAKDNENQKTSLLTQCICGTGYMEYRIGKHMSLGGLLGYGYGWYQLDNIRKTGGLATLGALGSWYIQEHHAIDISYRYQIASGIDTTIVSGGQSFKTDATYKQMLVTVGYRYQL